MIPAAAVEAAKEAMCEVTPPPGISKANWLAEHGDFALIAGAIAAAAPYMLAAAWVAGAQAGFNVTREGFNGECAFEWCADEDYPPTNPHSGEAWTVKDWTAQ